jgi:hypothetical protein
MRRTILTAAIGMAVAGTAMAQSSLNKKQEKEAIDVITGVGGTCERTVRTQTVGQLPDKTTLMAVACNGGDEERYVLSLDQRGNMSFYSTCEALAIANNNQVRCFT